MSTLEDFNNKHLSKKHVCPFCDFRTHDFESLMKQKNDLVEENQDIKNNLSEQQTKMNVHTQRQGPVREVYQQPGRVLRSIDMIGNGGAY